jgi:hypothetical protein
MEALEVILAKLKMSGECVLPVGREVTNQSIILHHVCLLHKY